MIEAWFVTSGGTRVDCHVPDHETVEIGAMVGMTPQDLFRIDVPAGASREARIRVLVRQDALNTLYASTADGANPSAVFYWCENDGETPFSLDLWLLPPRPLFMVPDGAGVAVVEAVDQRYWWKQSQMDEINGQQQASWLYSSDGRWVAATPASTTPLAFVTYLKTLLTAIVGTFTIPGGFAPSATLLNRVVDQVYTPEASLAMTLDMALSAFGWIFQWDAAAGGYTLVEVDDDAAALDSWMADQKRAIAGGLEATSGATLGTEPLLAVWQGAATWQRNRMPANATISYPYRSVEGKTRYDNANDFPADTVRFADQREFGWEHAVATSRARSTLGARCVKEPRALVASLTPTLLPASPGASIEGTTSPSWDYATLNTAIKALLVKRCGVMVGQTGWAGWVAAPNGAYRATLLRYTVGVRGGQVVPITITKADQDDWILGPSGTLPEDPRQIVFGKGLAHPRRLPSGAMQMDVPPPNTRVFPALITGFTQVDGKWIWVYEFEEVETNPLATTPVYKSIGSWARTGTAARNLMENGNVYTTDGASGNVVAPGENQVDYTTGTIEALPICIGSIVMMCEQFPTSFIDSEDPPPYPADFWFSTPNAVLFTCTPPG